MYSCNAISKVVGHRNFRAISSRDLFFTGWFRDVRIRSHSEPVSGDNVCDSHIYFCMKSQKYWDKRILGTGSLMIVYANIYNYSRLKRFMTIRGESIAQFFADDEALRTS